MDSNGTPSQRKRASRISKGSSETIQPTPQDMTEDTNVAALAIANTTIIPVSECRRSSRKKIIKFDVRDLLNKNRKPHKIQIEARIDSNVPSTSKSSSTTSGECVSNSSVSTAAGLGDLSSKQKTFMEKSAIFRRFSISQEQTKPPPPPIPIHPTILSKASDIKDHTSTAGSSGKRINRTQEYYSNVILKPKQSASLIVAQMESNVRSAGIKGKSCIKTIASEVKTLGNSQVPITPPQQKRRGRPPKARPQELTSSGNIIEEDSSASSAVDKESAKKLTPEKATNWKEYKACLAQQTDETDPSSYIPADLSKDMEVYREKLPSGSICSVSRDEKNEYVDHEKVETNCKNRESPNQQESKKMLESLEHSITQTENIELNTASSSQTGNKPFEPIKQDISDTKVENLQELLCTTTEFPEENLNVDIQTCENVDSVVQFDAEYYMFSEKEIKSVAIDHTLELKNDNQLEMEIISLSGESIATDGTQHEKSNVLSRTSSLSESENSRSSIESSTVASTLSSNSLISSEKESLEKRSSKKVSSITMSPKNDNEENKKTVTKRSKRLQVKNKRVEKKETPSKNIADYFEKTQNAEKESSMNSDDKSKCSNESHMTIYKSIQLSEESILLINEPKTDVENSTTDTSIPENVVSESENNCLIGEINDLKVEVNLPDKRVEQPHQELMKNDSNKENPSASIPKENSSIKQRKSLRIRKDKIILDIEKNKQHQTEEENIDDESAKDAHGEAIEQVQSPSFNESKELEIGFQKIEEEVSTKEKEVDLSKDDFISSPEKEVNQFSVPITAVNEIEKIFSKAESSIIDQELTCITTTNVDCDEHEGEQELNKSLVQKSKPDTQKLTSTKRKSLRNQKDTSPEKEDEIELISVVEQNATTTKVEYASPSNLFLEESIEAPKRKPRKSRFKNLHQAYNEPEFTMTGKDDTMEGKPLVLDESKSIDKETECHAEIQENTKKTPITQNEDFNNKIEVSTEIMDNVNIPAETAKDITKDTIVQYALLENDSTTTTLPDLTKDNPDIHSTLNEESTKTYVIKNVSIETNTLLDILRTVQSNKEAQAQVEAHKTVNSVSEIYEPESLTVPTEELHDIDESDNISLENPPAQYIKLKELIDKSNSKSNSPNRSASASPSTLKKIQNSPSRSDTSSPIALKKINISPSRSDTSSPLTFNKKITRRYERRSRRGDDESTHKTLEETFAEIAALSSKAAVLEMTTQQTNVIEDANSEGPKRDEEDLSKDEKEEILKEVEKMEMNSDIKYIDETSATQLIEPNTTYTEKAKSPISDIKTSELQDSLAEGISQEESERISQKKDLDNTLQCVPPILKEIVENVLPTAKEKDNVSVFNATCIASSADGHSPETGIEISKETTLQNETQPQNDLQTNSDTEEDIQENCEIIKENAEEISEQLSFENISQTKIKVGEDNQSPKCTSKKRDSSLTKSEFKCSKKSYSKKSKSAEKLEIEKTDESTIKTTTPPPKRGRKAKLTHQDHTISPANTNSTGKKKLNKEQSDGDKEEVQSPGSRHVLESDTDSVCIPEKSLDEILAKKKRQRKLKEDFEAALNDNPIDLKQVHTPLTPSSSPRIGLSCLNKTPPPLTETDSTTHITSETTNIKLTSVTPSLEPEEDPDPLKDIEKFIEDGVNLLKKGYKLDNEDSVDNVIPSKSKEKTEENEIKSQTQTELPNKEEVFNAFETPADTPLVTPSVTPPPKSPELAVTLCEEQTSGGVRRSHRIKLITKMPKALVGRGLVRDKERFSIKDDVETKSHYTLDDHLLDLAEVEAKNAKFLKEMEERLSNFHVIKENEYKCERVISREARKMICDCFLTAEEEERGELACGEDCLNRLLMIECGPECNVKERCTNKRFQKFLCSPCRVFRTEKKGFGILADIEILPGEFIMEYVGEVIDTEEFERRRIAYSQDKNRHYYFMALRSDAIIDATIKGNISRFINHSCDPNAETQKWTVNGELRIGFFSRKSIMPGEEITFDYQYQRYGREAQRCYCESSNCRGWIGQEPNSDEGEQVDDDDESYDEEDEEDTSNLLEEDDEDSDASVSDPEEVQKKLEMAAAQAQVELAPIALDAKTKESEEEKAKEKEQEQYVKTESEEDSKSKFKKLLSKMAEKVAAKHKATKREQKLQRKKKSKESASELTNKQRSLEDPDIEDEVEFLSRCGLKTQSDTLRLSRLMVRAKLVQTRLNLLEILRKGELPCRRLFLDYHGLRLVHGWMSEDAGNMQIRLALLQTLELLPIANKTVLTDSKVMQVVRNWCGSGAALSPNEDSLSSNSNSQDGSLQPTNNNENLQENSDCGELQKLALKLIATWEGLPEIFRIPKKERIEQMKEHEREADRQYAENEGDKYATDHYRTNRFGRRFPTTSRFVKPHNSKQLQQNSGNSMRTPNMTPENIKCLSKTQRREMFAAKVARDEAEKRMAEERREFETKCRFFGLDPKKTRPQDVPFCVNPATGQWYSVDRKPITTPPSYAHVQVPVKTKSTNPIDYQLPSICSALPPQWKFAITPLGQIYYYHVQYRIPQWEPPSPSQLQLCEINIDDVDSGNEHTPTTGPESSDDDDEILIGMDAVQLKSYIDRKVEIRRQKRYQRLVDERSISPRREEDRIYNQLEVRKYKENKEKIRKRKEEIRRRRAEALRQSSLNLCTLGSLTDSASNSAKSEAEDDNSGVLPIQDYLLSSDEDEDIKAEVNSPLIDKIVEGDKIVDELDALTIKRSLKRTLPSHRDVNQPSPSSSSSITTLPTSERQDYKKRKLEKKDKRKSKEQDTKYRRTKEKFRCEIAGIIVHHLKPYRKDSCVIGRIKSNEDFNHLARKLTHFVMIKELKYCESVGQTLVVTESVKNKSREFIKKYMAKYGEVYVKPANDPEFKDIPFSL